MNTSSAIPANPQKKPIRIIAIGISRNGEPFEITAVDDVHIGIRCAEAGLNPDSLSPTAKAAYARAITKRHDDVHGFEALLNALRDGKTEPLAPMSEETHEAISEEWIGQEHSTTSGHPQ